MGKKGKAPKVEPQVEAQDIGVMPEMALPLDLELLKEVLSIQTHHSGNNDADMMKYIVAKAKVLAPEVELSRDHYGNIYAVKGTPLQGRPYPCVVSHTDTVHYLTKDLTVVQVEDVLFGMNMYEVRPTGIGGDDKVGVYICLEMLRHLPAVKAVFFRHEESGCRGSAACDMSFFADVAFVLQADRKGWQDFINHSNGVEIYGPKFLKEVQPTLDRYGYQKCGGVATDVGQLKRRGLRVCAVNLSCGYYNAHGAGEYIKIYDVQACLSVMYELFQNYAHKVWHHTLPPPPKWEGKTEEEWEKTHYKSVRWEHGVKIESWLPKYQPPVRSQSAHLGATGNNMQSSMLSTGGGTSESDKYYREGQGMGFGKGSSFSPKKAYHSTMRYITTAYGKKVDLMVMFPGGDVEDIREMAYDFWDFDCIYCKGKPSSATSFGYYCVSCKSFFDYFGTPAVDNVKQGIGMRQADYLEELKEEWENVLFNTNDRDGVLDMMFARDWHSLAELVITIEQQNQPNKLNPDSDVYKKRVQAVAEQIEAEWSSTGNMAPPKLAEPTKIAADVGIPVPPTAKVNDLSSLQVP
jgi:hypothetical protein